MSKRKTLSVSEELNKLIQENDVIEGEEVIEEPERSKGRTSSRGTTVSDQAAPLGRLDADDSALLKQFLRTENTLFGLAQERAREADALASALRIIQASRMQTIRNILVTKYQLDPDKDYRIDENDVIWPVESMESSEEG